MARATQDRIGRELRVVFAEPLHEPLPDRLLGALRALEDAEQGMTRMERPTAPRALRFAEASGSFAVAETEEFALT
jgi:hypothetical protein